MADRPENKMGTKPIGKLLFFMSIPAIFSMLIQSIYNVVDSMYVARINLEDNNAINALSLAFPIQMLMMAIALGIGVEPIPPLLAVWEPKSVRKHPISPKPV